MSFLLLYHSKHVLNKMIKIKNRTEVDEFVDRLKINLVDEQESSIFIDREEAKDFFFDHLEHRTSNNKCTFLFYGVGGVGKSSLKEEIKRLLFEKYGKHELLILEADFNNTNNLVPAECLASMVESSIKSGASFRFPYFRKAYGISFNKRNPNFTHSKKRTEYSERFKLFLAFLSPFDNGLFTMLAAIIDFFIGMIDLLFTPKDIKKSLKALGLKPLEVVDRQLPMFLALDIARIRQKHKNLNVFFILDTLEELDTQVTEITKRSQQERWLQDIINIFEKDIFVLFGRDKLVIDDSKSNQNLFQFELKGLETGYSVELLRRNGIKEDSIINKITLRSQGNPYYLQLSSETYRGIISKNQVPKEKDFGLSPERLVERFVKNMDIGYIRTIKIVSILNYYNRNIYKYLASKFRFKECFEEFNGNSLITNNNGRFYIHKLLREGLLNNTDKDTISEVHESMFFYYQNLLDNGLTTDTLVEIIYHKSAISSIEQFNEWSINIVTSLQELQKQGNQAILLNIYNTILNRYSLKDLSIDLAGIYIDIIHLGGQYETSVEICNQYLKEKGKEKIFSDPKLLRIWIRKIHHCMFWLPVPQLSEEARFIYTQIKDKNEHELECELLFLIGGNLGLLSGNFEESSKWLELLSIKAKTWNMCDYEIRAARKIVDLKCLHLQFKEALSYSQSYINEKSNLNNRYMIYFLGTMAELYRQIGNISQAINLYNKLQEMCSERNLIGWYAHSYLGLSLISLASSEKNKAEEYCNKAKNIYARINHAWGKVNSAIVQFLITPETTQILLDDATSLAEANGYSYEKGILSRIKDGGVNLNEYRLLFL